MNPSFKYSSFILAIIVVSFIYCSKEYSCEQCGGDHSPVVQARNQPPHAIAFYDSLNNQPIGSELLTGKYSSDPDGTIVSYQWKQTTGPSTAIISDPQSFQTIVSNLSQGTYSFELTVIDNGGLEARDTVVVTVHAAVTAKWPKADAGVDQTITLPLDSTYLDGSLSNPNVSVAAGGPVHFKWTTISGPGQPLLSLPLSFPLSIRLTSAMAKGLVPGVYMFTVKVVVVANGGPFTDIDTVRVTVLDDPQNKNTVAFHNLTWENKNVNSTSQFQPVLMSSLRPDLFFGATTNRRPIEVHLKVNATALWTQFSNTPVNPFYYDLSSHNLWMISHPGNPLLLGTKSDMRIKFL